MTKIELPAIDYAAVAPLLVLFGVATVGVLVEALLPRRWRYPTQLVLSLGGIVAALILVVLRAGSGVTTGGGSVTIDGPALFMQGALLVFGLVAVLLIADRSVEPGGAIVSQAAIPVGSEADQRQAMAPGATEVFPLAMFSLAGMGLFVAASDLLLMFIALEVLSLPLYLMCALARRRRLLSQEAALKYFLLGAYASGFFIFGTALIYGFAGTVDFSGIHEAVVGSAMNWTLLAVGLSLIVIGLLFKAAAAPFHVWTPDVYQGAPTPVTAFMAACTKVAAFGAMLRVLYVAFERVAWDWQPVVGVVAVLTMLLGAVLAVTQTDLKRLLAYSSIANAGYVLVGLVAIGREGASATMFYLVAYGFAVIAAFTVVSLLRDADGHEATHLSRWAGLGPYLAGDGQRLHAHHAGAGGNPTHRRLHREVRGLRRGDRGGPRVAGHRRRGEQRHPRLPLPAGGGDGVAVRPGRVDRQGGDPWGAHLCRPRGRSRGDRGARRGAGAAAGLGSPRCPVRAMTAPGYRCGMVVTCSG